MSSDKAVSTESNATTSPASAPEAEKTYDELVLWAAKGALLVLVVKILSVLALGQFYGAPLSIDFWFGFIPHLLFATNQGNFTLIVTVSSLLMAVAALVFVAMRFVDDEPETRQRSLGRGVACVIALQTVGLEIIRHQIVDDTVRWRLAWVVIVVALIGIALVATTMWKDSSRGVDEREIQGSPSS